MVTNHTSPLDENLTGYAETLLRAPGLPDKIKRDVRNLLCFPTQPSLPGFQQAVRLLDIYERGIILLTLNPRKADQDITDSAEKEMLIRLQSELQQLITELDFEGEAGEKLLDIRARLLLDIDSSTLLEHVLEVLRLILEGTRVERKSSEKFLNQVNDSLSQQLDAFADHVQQSDHCYSQHRSVSQALSRLVTQSQNALASETEDSSLKQAFTPIVKELAELSSAIQKNEEREQRLLEQLQHSKNQLEAMMEITQNYHRRLEIQQQRMMRDPLTKAYNRTAFYDLLEQYYQRSLLTQQPLRLALFNIDRFKEINTRFGYAAGDKALKIIARTLAKSAAKNAVLSRFSGQEFALIISRKSEEETHTLVQDIQKAVAKLPFKFRDTHLQITMTACCITFSADDIADTALDKLNKLMAEIKVSGTGQLAWQ